MDSVSLQEEQLMHRFFIDPDRSSDDVVSLMEEDARHAVTVLRLKEGNHIEIIGNGLRFEAEIISADRQSVLGRKIRSLPSTEPGLSVTLFQGLPKGDKMDMIVQKATELGVSRIVPVVMSRCVMKLSPSDVPRKMERWSRIIREASKQSGRCMIPGISSPVTLQELAGMKELPGTNIVPWENAEGDGPLSFRNTHPDLSSVGILIGPEGGIDEEEILFLQKCGFVCLTLGKRILRTETAGLAAITAFMSLYGEMG